LITAVDTNVLIDLFGADPLHGVPSKEAMRSYIQQGSLVACEVVWAEVPADFPLESLALEPLHFGCADFRDPTAVFRINRFVVNV